MRITCVTFDAAEPLRIAEFWAAALGWAATPMGGAYGAICARPGVVGPYLEFVRVPEAKQVKNRVHLGTSVEGAEGALDAEIERLELLGATFAYEEDLGRADERNVVLLDPEGNEFCLGWHAAAPAAAGR
jgi:hypothetical protein